MELFLDFVRKLLVASALSLRAELRVIFLVSRQIVCSILELLFEFILILILNLVILSLKYGKLINQIVVQVLR